MNKPKPHNRNWRPTHTRPAAPKNMRMASRTRNNFYHTNRWRVASEEYRSRPENQFCYYHRTATGERVPTQCTDHVISLHECQVRGIDPMDETNWRPACTACNNNRGYKEQVIRDGRV